jgi:hypothetical protein
VSNRCADPGHLLSDTENTERQVGEMTANSSVTHEPATPSHLTRGMSVSEMVPPDIAASTTRSEEAKEG